MIPRFQNGWNKAFQVIDAKNEQRKCEEKGKVERNNRKLKF